MASDAKNPKRRGGNRGGSSRKERARGASLEARLAQVERWIAEGWMRSQIDREANRLWGLAHRSVTDYLTKVKERFAADAAGGRAEARAAQRIRLMHLGRLALKRKRPNLFAALAVEQQLATLEGTKYQPGDELPKTGSVEVVCDIDADEVLDEVEVEPAEAPKAIGAVA